MTESNPGQRAVDAYEIDDVFLVESSCRVQRDFNQSALLPELGLQHRAIIEPTVSQQVRTPIDGGQEIYIIRYFITGELRVLRDGVPHDKSDVADDETLAVLKLSFAADYRCRKEAFSDKSAIEAFGETAIFHVWPYWREAVHAFGARMRLPRITIPMMKARPGSRPVAVADSQSAQT